MTSEYDLVIIGSGSAATTVAFSFLENGKKIAVIDQKAIGGTCALRGCDPKKILVGVTDSLEYARKLRGHGISLLSGEIDWNDLMEFKHSFTQSMSRGIEKRLIDNGVKVIHGKARFVSPDTLEVDGKRLKAEKFLIASGMKAANLTFPGSEFLIDNEGFLDLPRLPGKLVFVGGGYISVEFASIARKAGSGVDIIQHSNRILVNFDREMAEILSSQLQDSGIGILTNASVKEIRKIDSKYEIVIKREGKEEIVYADTVVHGAGREFDSHMGLDSGNIKWSRKGVVVDEYLQSVSNRNWSV